VRFCIQMFRLSPNNDLADLEHRLPSNHRVNESHQALWLSQLPTLNRRYNEPKGLMNPIFYVLTGNLSGKEISRTCQQDPI
jgi:hypothetical protein